MPEKLRYSFRDSCCIGHWRRGRRKLSSSRMTLTSCDSLTLPKGREINQPSKWFKIKIYSHVFVCDIHLLWPFGFSPWERGYCVISKCDWKSTWCQLKYPPSACTRPHSLASLHNWKAWNPRIKKVVSNVGRIGETF